MKKRNLPSKRKIYPAIISLVIFISYVVFFPPEDLIYYAIFYLLLFSAVYFISNIFSRKKLSIIRSLLITAFFLMRQFEIDSIISYLILAGIFVTFEFYFRKT